MLLIAYIAFARSLNPQLGPNFLKNEELIEAEFALINKGWSDFDYLILLQE